MKRRYTEADLAKLPELEIGEDGYSFMSPNGRVRVDNAHPLDELFGGDVLGMLNVSEALRNIAGQTPYTIPLDDGLKRNVSKNEYDHGIVKRMTPERRDEPILLLVCGDGLNVIDGTHRLKRRIRDGLKDVKAYILRSETMAYMRVRMFRQGADGAWTQIAGMTDEDLDAHVRAAMAVEAKMTGKAV